MTTTKLYIYRKESIIIKIKLVALITILLIHLIMLKDIVLCYLFLFGKYQQHYKQQQKISYMQDNETQNNSW